MATNQLDMSNSPYLGVVPKTAFTACLDMYLRFCLAGKKANASLRQHTVGWPRQNLLMMSAFVFG